MWLVVVSGADEDHARSNAVRTDAVPSSLQVQHMFRQPITYPNRKQQGVRIVVSLHPRSVRVMTSYPAYCPQMRCHWCTPRPRSSMASPLPSVHTSPGANTRSNHVCLTLQLKLGRDQLKLAKLMPQGAVRTRIFLELLDGFDAAVGPLLL